MSRIRTNLVSAAVLLGATVLILSASFPVHATIETKLVAADGGGSDKFGNGVAVSGNTAIVGSPSAIVGGTHKGAAYIYIQSGGTWILQQRITASDGVTGGGFGVSVAISGDTAVVGNSSINGQFLNGAVYIFTRTGTVWTQQQKFTTGNPPGNLDYLGFSVAISNDTVVAGAPLDDVMMINQGADRGAAYIYTRSGNIWTQRQKIFASDHSPSRRFGNAVAISGSTVVVGERPNTAVGSRLAAAYFFILNGGTWTQQQEITASDGTIGDGFSWSVAINGDTAIIGALPDSNLGSAYVLTRSGTTWTEQQKLIPSDGATNKGFGSSVSMNGNTGLIGAWADTLGRGSAYVFTKAGTTWTQQRKLIPSDGTTNDQFGRSVSISGDLAIAGSPFADIGANSDQGSAYVYNLRSPFDFDGDGKSDISVFRPSTGAWYLQQSTAGLYGILFGFSTDKITPADFDGDGKTDIAVYRPSTGIWYVLRSSDGTVSYTNFGLAEDLPVPADYDGDGKADIAVFRPSTSTWYRQNSSDGSFYAIQFGASEDKPTLGDFDGDGKADIAVFRPSVGAWYRVNSSNGSIFGELFGFGSDVIVPADYDGDGKTDLAVFRPSNGFWYLKNSATSTYTAYPFGLSTDIPAPGDFDGDGKADLSVFRQSDGNWYRLNSSNGTFFAFQFGTNGDKPTQTAFRY